MGLIRKMTSVSTLGGVKYTSKREAQTKAAAAEGRAAREEAKLLKAQRRALKTTAPPVVMETPVSETPEPEPVMAPEPAAVRAGRPSPKETWAEGKAKREDMRDVREDRYAQHVQAYLDGQYPKWKLNTRELRLLREARKEQVQH